MVGAKKRTYLVILALGGGALLVDRLVLPSATEAEPLAVPRTSAAAGRAATVASSSKNPASAVEQSVPALLFPRTLPKWDPNQPIRDIFAPESSSALSHNSQRRSGREERDGHGTCAGLMRLHRLDAVLVQETLRIAVIDGVWVRIGQEVEGCKVLEVAGNEVRFACRDGETVLSLSAQGTPPEH